MTGVPLAGGGVTTEVTVLEATFPVPDVELRGTVDEENRFVVAIVEIGLGFEVVEEPRALLVEREPENVEIDCVGT